jgi:hypothetical protein
MFNSDVLYPLLRYGDEAGKIAEAALLSSIAVAQPIRVYQFSHPRLSKSDIRYLYVMACLTIRSPFRDTPRYHASFPGHILPSFNYFDNLLPHAAVLGTG